VGQLEGERRAVIILLTFRDRHNTERRAVALMEPLVGGGDLLDKDADWHLMDFKVVQDARANVEVVQE
jgi:hypothetical protein